MKRIFFHAPPTAVEPDVLRMIPPDGLERQETPPTGRFSYILDFGTIVVLAPAGILASVWLVAFVAARAVKFALGL